MTLLDFQNQPEDENSANENFRAPRARSKIEARDVSLSYGEKQALKRVSVVIPENEVTAFIGPSGCGKTTLLRCFNRMHDENDDVDISGSVLLRNAAGELEDIYHPEIDPPYLRRRYGWVAQKPDPFPDSVYQNLAYPAHIHGLVQDGADMDAHVEMMLRRASLWEELKDRLKEAGTDLSIGQQQRLCIARALSVSPEVLLMDEPCGSLDPISTQSIEELILALKGLVTIVLITHNMEQARRVADHTVFFDLGEIKAYGPTQDLFDNPTEPRLRSYLAGRFG